MVMADSLPANAALILIDVQQGFDDPSMGERNNLSAEANIARLLQAWRSTQRPIYHVQHLSVLQSSPLNPKHPGVNFKPEGQPLPGEPIITKSVNSAFIDTHLRDALNDAGIETLVMCGFTTQHCVSTTARMGGNLGYTVYVAADATAAFNATGYDGNVFSAQQTHDVSLATIHGEFATVLNTDDILEKVN